MARWHALGKVNTELTTLNRQEFLNSVREVVDNSNSIYLDFLDGVKKVKISDTDVVTTPDTQYMDPWSSDLNDEEAPEEADAPSPNSFDIPLSYMNKTVAEATMNFYQMIETRVSQLLRDSSDIVSNLKNKYLPVFVPHN